MGHPAPRATTHSDDAKGVGFLMCVAAGVLGGCAAEALLTGRFALAVIFTTLSAILMVLIVRGPMETEGEPPEWWVDPRSDLVTAIQKSYADGEIGPLEFEWKIGQVVEHCVNAQDDIWCRLSLSAAEFEFGEDGKLRRKLQEPTGYQPPKYPGTSKHVYGNWQKQAYRVHSHYLGYSKSMGGQTLYDQVASARTEAEWRQGLTKLIVVKVDNVESVKVEKMADMVNGRGPWWGLTLQVGGFVYHGRLSLTPTPADLRTMIVSMNGTIAKRVEEERDRAMQTMVPMSRAEYNYMLKGE